MRATLYGIPISREDDDLFAVLRQDPAKVNQQAIELSTLAFNTLPVGTLSSTQKATYGKLNTTFLPGQCETVDELATYCQQAAVKLELLPGQLPALCRKQAAYGRVLHVAKIEHTSAIDQRTLVSRCLMFLFDKVLGSVEARLSSPTLPLAERDALLDLYAPVLTMLDDLRREKAERKGELSAERKDLSSKLKEAKAEQAVAETKLMLAQDQLVSREALFELARRHLATRPTPPADATGAWAAKAPKEPHPMPPSGRILR
jgi:hypothetical protein